MCLQSSSFRRISSRSKKVSGTGYKVVRRTDNPLVFMPEWPGFNENGGTHQIVSWMNDVVYTIGQSYEVNHNRVTYAFEEPFLLLGDAGFVRAKSKPYKAGVHLYKEEPRVSYSEWAIVKFKYERAIAEDEYTVVAMKVTPIEVME